MLKPGTCRWCKCREERACPGGCAWIDRSATLCSACVPVEQAWRDEDRRAPNMRRAFFRGFMAGSKDARAIEQANPYPAPATAWGAAHSWWARGFAAAAGAIAGR